MIISVHQAILYALWPFGLASMHTPEYCKSVIEQAQKYRTGWTGFDYKVFAKCCREYLSADQCEEAHVLLVELRLTGIIENVES